ncbi:MAG: ABC transporter substrate-binding protein [Gemmatimonadota bacterium]
MSGSAQAAVELVALQAGGIEIEPVDVGQDEALGALRDLAGDPRVAAAVVGPWTPAPEGAIETLAGAAMPVVSLSSSWGPPAGDPGPWLSLAVDETAEAEQLLRAAGDDRPGRVCAAGGRDPVSRGLLAAVRRESSAFGIRRLRVIGTVDPERPEDAQAVAGRLAAGECSTLVWTGGAEAAAPLLEQGSGAVRVVATSRMKTDRGLALAQDVRAQLSTVCVCADITLSSTLRHQRFVHDFEANSADAPGPFAVEAYDATRLLVEFLRRGTGTRAELAARLASVQSFPGLVGRYDRRPGEPGRFLAATAGLWRARGSRWLPVEPSP